jgi:SAM-dependent methyltransferase
MAFSDAARQAAAAYGDLPNLLFIRGDIAHTGFVVGRIDYVNCDQVIMHTEDPERTFTEFARIASPGGGQVACYFYAKKALPRELLDDHFRSRCEELSRAELWAMSEQLTELGRRLSELKVSFDAPDIPALGIKGGRVDIQRFIYWNFMKCFWNPELSFEDNAVINYDWYHPQDCSRHTLEEVREWFAGAGLQIVHECVDQYGITVRGSRPA